MYSKIVVFAIVAVFGFHDSDCLAVCRPKLSLPMLSMQPMTVPVTYGLPCDPPSDCGPQPTPLPIIQAPSVTTPTITGPIIPLPSPPIPCPKTIAHRCVCTKTVVKPQLIQRCITVPTVQRYLKRTYTPIVENIAYKAKPKCSPCACLAKAPVAVPPPLPLTMPYSRIC